MAVPIGRPGSGGGGASGFDRNDHIGHSVLFINNEERRDVQTRNGKVDRVAWSEYVVCMTCGGKVFKEHMSFGQAIVPAILDGTEAVVLGTIGKGEASAGRSAPWLLFDYTDEEGEAAGQWLNTHAVTLPSGRLVIEDTEPTDDDAF